MGNQQANATWNGTLKEGNGTFTLPKGNYTGNFTFATRFENGNGTNPEELVGAALSGCFSMFLSALLSKKDYKPESIQTSAEVTLESTDNGPTITKIALTTNATVPNLSTNDFNDFVAEAKAKCPISKLYTGTTITVNAKLLTVA
jgi:osmotically inducible protein OsmC